MCRICGDTGLTPYWNPWLGATCTQLCKCGENSMKDSTLVALLARFVEREIEAGRAYLDIDLTLLHCHLADGAMNFVKDMANTGHVALMSEDRDILDALEGRLNALQETIKGD